MTMPPVIKVGSGLSQVPPVIKVNGKIFKVVK